MIMTSAEHSPESIPRLGNEDEAVDLVYWFEDDGVNENSVLPGAFQDHPKSSPYQLDAMEAKSPLESLSDDIMAAIMFHLTLHEIATLRLVSRSMAAAAQSQTLWKALLAYRWNLGSNIRDKTDNVLETIDDYRMAYQQAHAHPHDLWITHGNCTHPSDGLTPGRCYIPRPTSLCHSCTISMNDTDADTKTQRERKHVEYCPSCRHWKTMCASKGLSSDARKSLSSPSSSKLSAVSYAMSLSTQRLFQFMEPTCRKYCLDQQELLLDRPHRRQNLARKAFACSATCRRQVSTLQYEEGPTHFVSDLLFFPLVDSSTEQGEWELQQVIRREQDQGEDGQDDTDNAADPNPAPQNGDAPQQPIPARPGHTHTAAHHNRQQDQQFVTAIHSWHVVQLFNPDFYRPIQFHIAVQRPDCFAVFPSQGWLGPGQATTLTVGVRPLASALAHAEHILQLIASDLGGGCAGGSFQHQLPLHLPPHQDAWVQFFRRNGPLPQVPILIRYSFAPIPPMRAAFHAHTHDPRHARPIPPAAVAAPNAVHQLHQPQSDDRMTWMQGVLQHAAKHVVPEHHMREIALSAHVHSHYHFTDFIRHSLQPWNRDRYIRGLQDQQLEKQPSALQHKQPCYHGSAAFTYLGPNPFTAPYLQERFPLIHQRLQGTAASLGPSQDFAASGPCLACGLSYWGLREEMWWHAWIVAQMEIYVHMQRRMTVLTNISQCCKLLSHKAGLPGDPRHLSLLLTTMYDTIQSFQAMPWLSPRQWKPLLDMEAIIDHAYKQIPVGGADWMLWRISGTRAAENYKGDSLATDPSAPLTGKMLFQCIGSHCMGPQRDTNHDLPHTQPYYVSDVFLNRPLQAMRAGIGMIRNPQTLLVHGIYDQIPYPGSVLRRPRVPTYREALEQDYAIVSAPSAKAENVDFPVLIPSVGRLAFFQLQSALDIASMVFVDKENNGRYLSWVELSGKGRRNISLQNYLRGVPPLGVGRYPISQVVFDESTGRTGVASLEVDMDASAPHHTVHVESDRSGPAAPNPIPPVVPHRPAVPPNHHARPRGPHFLRLLWILGAQLGLAVMDSPDAPTVIVDRAILIGSQWISISLMASPLMATLCARWWRWIPVRPLEYDLPDLPFPPSSLNELHFLSQRECAFVAVMVLFLWISLARWNERHTRRDFFRIMVDHVNLDSSKRRTLISKLSFRCTLWFQRLWDSICPMFLQQRIYAPPWNRRTQSDLYRHIAYWRSQSIVEERSASRLNYLAEGSLFGDIRDNGIDIGSTSASWKVFIGLAVALGSFCASSPHFWLNVVTVFSGSISLGMSVSLHSIAKGRSAVDIDATTGSFLQSMSLVTVVISACLAGQLVGSSGGTAFLAEFIVTAISLILGGAGAISSSAMESWGCFFGLSTAAFWGYLFGRVALLDGIRNKRGGYSSKLLSTAVLFLFLFWLLVFWLPVWDTPVSKVILPIQHYWPPNDNEQNMHNQRKFAARYLQ